MSSQLLDRVWRPESRKAHKRHCHGRRFFFACHVYGGRAWETLGSAGFLEYRFANLRTAAPILFGDSGVGSFKL